MPGSAPPTSPVKLAPVVALALALAACGHAPLQEDRFRAPGGGPRQVEIVLHHSARDAAAALQVRRALRVALPRAERWGALTASITVTIHPTHEALEDAAGRPDHPWLRAWARPGGIELQAPRTWSRGSATDEQLEQLLTHELTHCVMYQSVGDDRRLARTIPVWFREGMATLSAGESFPDVGEPSAAAALAVTPLAYRDDARLVYAASDRAFRSLVERHGEERVRGILAAMRYGLEFDDAFWDAIGVRLEEFEAELRVSARPVASRG